LFLSFVDSIDNAGELLLEGSASYEEPINIRLSDELSSILLSDTASIEDSGLFSSLS
jgi:hypothetical protein